MLSLYVLAVGLQNLGMLVDELWFHRRRGLPRWERIGHPLDTLTVVACLVWLIVSRPQAPSALVVYAGLAVFSTVFVTKDEPVHARLCGGGEQWLHANLFTLHPVMLLLCGVMWWSGRVDVLVVQLALTVAFLAYQIVYWNVLATTGGR